MHVDIHKTQKLDLKSQSSSLAIDFDFIKEIPKLYKESITPDLFCSHFMNVHMHIQLQLFSILNIQIYV